MQLRQDKSRRLKIVLALASAGPVLAALGACASGGGGGGGSTVTPLPPPPPAPSTTSFPAPSGVSAFDRGAVGL